MMLLIAVMRLVVNKIRPGSLGLICHKLAVISVFWLLAFPATAQAPLDVRVALVIGNSAYSAAPLLNPSNDAKAMASALRGLGFKVVELREGNKEQMKLAISNVRDTLRGSQGVGMLYYAGHGIQLDWQNYMVPVDAKLTKAADVPQQTIDVGAVVDAFRSAGTRMNILVLDACRDNPFGGVASGKGLAQMDAPSGTILAYATAPGNVAEDGDVRTGNGLYTQYLLEELKKPGARIEDVFMRVRLNVRKQSQGRQIPWESTSLEDVFYFDANAKAKSRESDAETKTQEFLAEKADWEKIRSSTTADDFYNFLQKYPNGFIKEQAVFALERLQRSQVQVVANKDGVTPIAPTTRRYEPGDEYLMSSFNAMTNERRQFTLKVTFADDNRVEINGGSVVFDQTGGLIKDRYGVRTPSKLLVPSDVAVGKRWRTAYQMVSPNAKWLENNFIDFHVAGYETISIGEKSIKTLLIIGKGEARPPDRIHFLDHRIWVDPQSLKRLREEWSYTSKGVKREHWVLEQLAFKRVKN